MLLKLSPTESERHFTLCSLIHIYKVKCNKQNKRSEKNFLENFTIIFFFYSFKWGMKTWIRIQLWLSKDHENINLITPSIEKYWKLKTEPSSLNCSFSLFSSSYSLDDSFGNDEVKGTGFFPFSLPLGSSVNLLAKPLFHLFSSIHQCLCTFFFHKELRKYLPFLLLFST